MATRTVTLTAEERRLLAQLVGRAWAEAEHQRLMARIDSPQEQAAKDDLAFIEALRLKLNEA